MNKTEAPKGGARRKNWKHPNPPRERIIEYRGIKKTVREWSELCGITKASLVNLERRGYLAEQLDFILQNRGIMP